jgi:hypothetical protein
VNDKTLLKICLVITIIGIVALLLTYQEEFQETTITKLLSTPGEKGIISGRIEYVIKNYPISIFILNDGNKTTIYAPKSLSIETNDYVKVYAENQIDKAKGNFDQKIFAHKVVKE